MSYQKEKDQLKNLIMSGYPLIYIVSEDERPVVQTLKEIASESEREYDFYTWDVWGKFYNENLESYRVKIVEKAEPEKGKEEKTKQYTSGDLIEKIRDMKKNTIGVFHDFHHWLTDKNDNIIPIRRIKETIYDISMPFTKNYSMKKYENRRDRFFKHIIITSPVLKIPRELEKYFHVVEFGLPRKEEVRDILEDVITENKLTLNEEEKEQITNSSLGLTESQIFYAYKKSIYANDGTINHKDIFLEKKQIVKKSGVLEFLDMPVAFEEIGGLSELIHWVKKRKLAFNDEIREKYHIDLPKGLLMTGVQGCGKSYSVKAIASYLQVPLIRLDLGHLMGRYLGESESNLRKAIEVVESVSPCVLWIDEIEKGIPNFKSDSAHDTVKRMGSTLLTWLQEKTSPVFVVATANDIESLPPELMRKGRFDEIFFIDLPKMEERKEIFSIHFWKRKIDEKDFDIPKLAEKTEGFSGAEIEVLINEAILQAASDNKFLSQEYLLNEIPKTNPISVTMKEQIKEIRDWARKHNVRPASEFFEKDKGIGFL